MFELPLLPHRIAYGQIQRRLAAKYHISLIPKRYFIDVIGGADATSDGLHLSDAGMRRMAALVARVLSPVLKSPATMGSGLFTSPAENQDAKSRTPKPKHCVVGVPLDATLPRRDHVSTVEIRNL
jgi:hypothetical protein